MEAARAIGAAIRNSRSSLRLLPLSDGGDGFAGVLTKALGGSLRVARVRGPLGDSVPARWGWIPSRKTAVIEMAQASGMGRLPRDRHGRIRKDAMRASTFGTGQLIRKALEKGAKKILLGIGGSATVDAGAGCLSALGAKFLDRRGRPIPPGGGGLARLGCVHADGLDPRLAAAEILVACDVRNPLFGRLGGIRVYAPQKGAALHQVRRLEKNFRRFLRIAGRDISTGRGSQRSQRLQRIAQTPGAGAAGGLGFALAAFCGAKMVPGIGIIFRMLRVEEEVRRSDLVITAEGTLDRQSFYGKVLGELARLCRRHRRPLWAVAGRVRLTQNHLRRLGISRAISLVGPDLPLSLCLARPREALIRRVRREILPCLGVAKTRRKP